MTPTLNAERFIERTLDSIWGQRTSAFEIDHVVVDGGSTDRTLEIVAGYQSRVLVATDDGGMYDAVNRGMRLVRGEVIGYINGDDEIAPGALEVVVETFEAHPGVGWVCGRVEYIDGKGSTLGFMMPVHLSLGAYLGLGWSCIPQQTVWTRRSFFDRVGPYDVSYRNCGDYDWYARALQIEHPLMVRRTLGRFRLHPGQISLDPEKMKRESRMVQERYGRRNIAMLARGRLLSLRLNASNLGWLLAKKRGRISFKPPKSDRLGMRGS